MLTRLHRKRLFLIFTLVGGVSLAVALILYAFTQNINLFYTPTQCVETKVPQHKTIRVGGMVVKGSFKRLDDLKVEFIVTDFNQEIPIYYQGILPDLFKEGQGIVALGKLDEHNRFVASQVLAKHDEKYMPPEITASLKTRS